MVCWQDRTFPDSVDNGIFVDSQGERLADADVVEWLYQVVHGVIIDPQLGYLIEIFALLVSGEGRDGYAGDISLTGLIGAIGVVWLLVEGGTYFFQLWVGSIVVGIGYEVKLLALCVV